MLPRNIIKDLDKITSKVASKLLAKTKQNCPVDTGNLKSSLEKNKVKTGEYEVGSDCEYSKFVEHGTIKQRPQKFMGRAVEEVIREDV